LSHATDSGTLDVLWNTLVVSTGSHPALSAHHRAHKRPVPTRCRSSLIAIERVRVSLDGFGSAFFP
jgi:hypothetical protein